MNKLKKVFIGHRKPRKITLALEGPINGCADDECVSWRNRVKKELGKWYEFHDPMAFDCRGHENEMRRELVAFDTVGIAGSEVVLVMAERPGWGTAMAVQMAWEAHKYIVAICSSDRPSPWLVDRSSIIVPTLNDAIGLLIRHKASRFTPMSNGRYIYR